jgi:hypothetical protein
MELDPPAAARAFGNASFNLIRRGADGSLVLSADRWRLTALTDAGFAFAALDPAAPAMNLPLADVVGIRWERLPRQRVRSQVRFTLASGDVWTFSGSFTLDEPTG